MKDLIFNELTEHPLAADFSEAFKRVKQILETYKKRPSIFDKRIRLDTYIGELQLTESLSLQEFCNKTPQSRTLGSLLLGLGKHPFIDGDTPEEDHYLESSYVLNYNGCQKESIGLAAAHLNDTICIGFESEAYWKEVEHQIEISDGDDVSFLRNVLSVSASGHFGLPVFEEWLVNHQPVSLVGTSLESIEKQITLRDDHGKDVLQRFSKRLRKSPYVTAIVNSLPFNPNQRDFIKSVSAKGLIEIVLIHTDKGIGIAVQTTGRNFRETKKIAEILRSEYA